MPELTGQLKQLRLSGILDSLDVRNRQAIDSQLPFVDFLALLIGDEVARREQKTFTMRLRRNLQQRRDLRSVQLRAPAEPQPRSRARTWSATGSLNGARAFHTATLLHNGTVLAAGGEPSSTSDLRAEIYY